MRNCHYAVRGEYRDFSVEEIGKSGFDPDLEGFKAGDVTLVERLPGIREVLGSICNTDKNKTKQTLTPVTSMALTRRSDRVLPAESSGVSR